MPPAASHRATRRLLDALRRLEQSLPRLSEELIALRNTALDTTPATQFSLVAASVVLAIRAVENDLEIVRHTTNDLLTPSLPDGGV